MFLFYVIFIFEMHYVLKIYFYFKKFNDVIKCMLSEKSRIQNYIHSTILILFLKMILENNDTNKI